MRHLRTSTLIDRGTAADTRSTVSRAKPRTLRAHVDARISVRLADVAMESVTRLVLATLAGSLSIVVPIALWATLGDGDALRTAGVVLASLLVSYGVVRQILRPLARVPAGGWRPAPPPVRSSCHAGPRRRVRVTRTPGRGRDLARPASCRAAAPRRASGSRPLRDVRCSAGAHPIARRSTRRRTRP